MNRESYIYIYNIFFYGIANAYKLRQCLLGNSFCLISWNKLSNTYLIIIIAYWNFQR